MSAAQAISPQQNFGGRAVLSRSLKILLSNIVPFTLTALVGLLPLIAAEALSIVITSSSQSAGQLDPSVNMVAQGLATAGVLLSFLVFIPATGAVLVNATLQHMHDGKARMWNSIKQAFALLFRLILLMLIILLVAMIGAAAAVFSIVTWGGKAREMCRSTSSVSFLLSSSS